MTLYTRRQLLVLLVLLAAAGLGLAVGHWRRARPDVADYLEQLDRAPAPVPSVLAPPPGGRPPSAASSSSEIEPRRSRRGIAPRASPASRSAASRVAPSAETVDLNRATATELARLPGIGSVLARRIVDARDVDGPFARVDALGRVQGLTARKLERLRALLTVSE